MYLDLPFSAGNPINYSTLRSKTHFYVAFIIVNEYLIKPYNLVIWTHLALNSCVFVCVCSWNRNGIWSLTHWGRDKMAVISQTILSNAFWMEISIKISLKFVPKGLINNIPALVQVMAWRRPGDKPLTEPMEVKLLTHICVTRPQWVNLSKYLHFDNYMLHYTFHYTRLLLQ